MTGAIVNFIVFIPFVVFAYYLSQGKGAFLLSGYNTMSAEKKAKIDEMALCRFMSKIMYGLSFCIGLFAVSELLNQPILFIVGLVSFILLVIFAVVYSNTGNRFIK
ncbi:MULTISPECIES: DUF3784 domain-containing protein [unclassified Sporosarcina]|uniref:DUF3784 domain-containing protein n=1 Tax=unclassified Sporosarcina TaxID=2647733 RepID=UPI0020414C94|nr:MULTISPECIES: DUF3784 domain-containing protein [unclassified Sporosarcina]GKV64700.1 membrane protein [Sporosarcina sp. NCCP-2331]GLB54810.1 membrane protein [Sporosarcina sp. NCCP-2378]